MSKGVVNPRVTGSLGTSRDLCSYDGPSSGTCSPSSSTPIFTSWCSKYVILLGSLSKHVVARKLCCEKCLPQLDTHCRNYCQSYNNCIIHVCHWLLVLIIKTGDSHMNVKRMDNTDFVSSPFIKFGDAGLLGFIPRVPAFILTQMLLGTMY